MSPTKAAIDAAVVPGSWDEIEEQEFKGEYETLDNGTYPFVLVDAEKREGQDSGNEYLHVRLLHEKDEAEVAEGGQVKFNVWDNLHFTPKTVGNTKRILRIMGVPASVWAGLPFEEGVVPDEIMEAVEDCIDGASFQVRVKRTRYKDDSDEVRFQNAVVRYIG